jgi:hypothetical protein
MTRFHLLTGPPRHLAKQYDALFTVGNGVHQEPNSPETGRWRHRTLVERQGGRMDHRTLRDGLQELAATIWAGVQKTP